MIRVIDDFIHPSYYNAIENNVLQNFVWKWSSSISGGNVSIDNADSSRLFGFSHLIFDAGKSSSQFYEFLLPFFIQAQSETDAKDFLRARGDMTVISGEQVTYQPHIDMPSHKDHINMIFYIGDSDGDTIIYKEKYSLPKKNFYPFLESEPKMNFYTGPQVKTKLVHSTELVPKTLTVEQQVTPKANRLVIFNGEHWHTGQSPKNHSRRVILNLNFAPNDYRVNK